MQITNSNSSAPFGFCECGAENAGSYYGGAIGYCQTCFDKQQQERKKNAEEEAQVAALESARKFAEKQNISLSEAILLIK